MNETGKVIAVKNGTATVRVDKKDECSRCGLCLFNSNAKYTEFPAENRAGAEPGDTVVIERKEKLKTLSIVLIFLVPLLLIGAACSVTYLFLENDVWILPLSVIFIFLWYTILALIDKKLRKLKGFDTVVTQIVKKEEIIADGDNGNNR